MLTKENILQALGSGAEEQIYFEYIGLDVKPGRYYTNPFPGTGASKKTMKIYVNKVGHIGFKDFSPDRSEYNGDCFTAAMFVTGKGFFETLVDIDNRFRLGLSSAYTYTPSSNNKAPYKPLDPKEYADIQFIEQPFTTYDKKYFEQYKIYAEIPRLYGVKSAKIVTVNGRPWNTSCPHLPLFVYHYEDAIMKAYSPKNYKRKWANNANKDTIDSLKYLPKHVDKLVIASGKKDGLIFATHGYHQVSFLSETVIPAKLEELLVRCDKVYAWLDCDAPGIAATEKLIEKYPMIEPIHWKSKQKDISDFSKHNNFNITKNLLESNLGKPSFVWEHSSTGMSRCFV